VLAKYAEIGADSLGEALLDPLEGVKYYFWIRIIIGKVRRMQLPL
jgi:hypothetical protein